eukprot:1128069-Rhodomonas_salina.1
MRLQRVRHRVREGRARSPLFDSATWASHFSDGLDRIWGHHIRKDQLPSTLRVGQPIPTSGSPGPPQHPPPGCPPVSWSRSQGRQTSQLARTRWMARLATSRQDA